MTFHLGAPQLIYLGLVVWNIVDETVKHGTPRPAHNVWTTLAGTAVSIALLWWGGFFG